ncbi:hypothetical protein ACHAPE_007632 [Trichoderma viride]
MASYTNEMPGVAQESETRDNDEISAIDEPESNSGKSVDEEEENQRNHSSSQAATYSPPQLAAQNGHGEIVRELLQHGNNSDRDRGMSLLLAAKEGFVEIVEMLLKSSIAIRVHDKDGNTALHLAADGGYTSIVKQLVTYKSENSEVFDTRAANFEGWTPLHFTAKSGRPVTLQMLLDHGAEMDDRDKFDQTAFHIAAFHGHVSILHELFNRPDSREKLHRLISAPNKSGDTPFLIAVRNGHFGVTKYILDTVPLDGRRRSFYQGRNNALTKAVRLQHFNLVNLLLDYAEEQTPTSWIPGIKVQSIDQSPIHRAAQRYPEALETLLKDRGGVKIDIDSKGKSGRTAIWQASYARRPTAVERLLELSPDLEIKDSAFGWTALHAAYTCPHSTKLLLDAGANPMALSNNHKMAFMVTAEKKNGHLVIEHYVNNTAECDFNFQDQEGKTALHFAATSGSLQTVKLLCSNNASITATTHEGVTALHYAAAAGQVDMIEYLIKGGVDINSKSKVMGTPLMSAASTNRRDAAKFLLHNGAKVDLVTEECRCHSALQTAAAIGSEFLVQVFLEAGADPNTFGGEYGSPLCAAARAGNIIMARQLLEAGADVDYSKGLNGTALEWAIDWHKTTDSMRILLEHKANVNIPSNGEHGTPLIAAISKDRFEHVKILLEHGADPNLSSSRGETPFQAALRSGSRDMLNILLENGAQLVFKAQWGRGPLSTAISSKSLDLLPYLWEHPDVDFNERDVVGRTPLLLSALHGVDLIKDLQDHGADIDAQDNWGRTALIYAVIRNDKSMVTELIMGDAALSLKDIRGHDALYWAAERPEVFMEILQQMKGRDNYNEILQHAINATIALNAQTLAEELLKLIVPNPSQTDDNGWTIYDTAARYKNEAIRYLIDMAVAKRRQTPLGKSLDSVRIPTQWHPLDLSPALKVSSNGTCLTVSENFQRPDKLTYPMGVVALADHPMWPQQDEVYYFEVKIEHEGDGSR